jgi:hypothetical protein
MNGHGDEGLVWFRDGQVYAVSVPGRRPLLGIRLVTAGAISPDQLNDALELQRNQMPTSRLGEVLVKLGLVNRRVIENFALEQQRDMLADLLGWQVDDQRFRNGAHTRTDIAPFTDVADLLNQARLRQQHWPAVVEDLGGVDAVPLPTGMVPHAELATAEAVVFRLVDGVRTLTDIADECGFTVFEAADVTLGLVAAGLVTTAAELLHDPRPAEADADGEPLAEVLELHPLHVVPDPVVDAVPDPVVDAVPEPVVTYEPEPIATFEPEPVTTFEPAATFEPAQPAEPAAASFSALPPPTAARVEWPQPIIPAPSSEPADTAALLRELSGLGQRDDA